MWCCWALFFVFCTSFAACEFTLTLVHHNDIHSFIVPSREGIPCRPEDYDKCFGGIARLATAVRRLRKEENFLHVNAGDMYQGTVWYTFLKWRGLLTFTNMLKMHAMAPGNHEFDDGVEGLIPYLKDLNVPIVAANVDLSHEPELAKYIQPSVVIDYNNVKVGIIGYITPDTKDLASPGKVKFLSEEVSIAKEAARLKEQGVDILIALGHSGYNRDKEIAEAVPLLDVVVGGHSHSFLYSGEGPAVDNPEGPYPTVITQPSGRKVLVLQAKSYTKYLGRLKIDFTDDGEVKAWEGQPILLDNSIPEDPEFMEEIKKWSSQLDSKLNEVIGETTVRLDGFGDECDERECLMGNLFADAILHKFLYTTPGPSKGFSQVNGAFINSGALRATLEQGKITYGDIVAVHPFNNEIYLVTLSGKELHSIFEHTVSLLNTTANDLSGGFLQVSGMRVQYNMCPPSGSPVGPIEVLCAACEVPQSEQVTPDDDYVLAVTDYLTEGGDGYAFKEKARHIKHTGLFTVDIVSDYVAKNSPITPRLDQRIEIYNKITDCNDDFRVIFPWKERETNK